MNSRKQKFIFSFDYELFLGPDSGTINESLLTPTDKILDIFERHSAIGIFYVDTLFLIRCKSDSPESFLLIKNQILRMKKLNCTIGLHIHPHWLDAKYTNGRWDLSNNKRFRFHDCSTETRAKIVQDSLEILREVLDDNSFTPSCYRAGGWCADPFELINNEILSNGISYDSSILPGQKSQSLTNRYDYRDFEFRSSWKIGDVTEIPVNIISLSGLHLLINKVILRFKKQKSFGNGKGAYKVDSMSTQLKRIFQTNNRVFSIDNISFYLLRVLLWKLRKYSFVQAVLHPKSISTNTLEQIEYLCLNRNIVDYKL